MAEKDDVRWGLAQRFEFIEWRAYWVGRVNRSDLEDRFRVSTPQASVDLRAYQEAVPNNIEYDATERTYVPTDEFAPKYLKLSANLYLRQLDAIQNGTVAAIDTWFGSLPHAAVMEAVTRSVEPDTLRRLLRGIEQRSEIEVEYRSLTNTRRRPIAPHALAFDGRRWHVRAWCAQRAEFRDFVLSRILAVGESCPSKADPTHDMEWNTLLDMKIVPHPGLTENQKLAIERDYGMKDGTLTVTTRAALAFYLERHLNLDLPDSVLPERKQLYLTNKEQIENIRLAALEETQVLVGKSVAGSVSAKANSA